MTGIEKIGKGAVLLAEGLAESMQTLAAAITNAFESLAPKIKPILDIKYTKKKFKKMLQSYGIQRNEINKIIASNKGPYTMSLLYKCISRKESKWY